MLSEDDSEIVDSAILPDLGRAGGWIYSNETTVEGSGDFDGDGRDEMLVTNPWRLGILKFDGSSWQALVVKNNGTWFGDWLYYSTESEIEGIGDFNGDGRDDILVTKPWGLGILTLQGDSLTTILIESTGSVLNDWTYNQATQTIGAIDDFNGDGTDDILIRSERGLGILVVWADGLVSVVSKPDGAWFGSWNYDSRFTWIRGTGDFDGDGAAEVLVRSDCGVGVLKLTGTSLTTLALHSHGSRLLGWDLVRLTEIRGIGDLNGDDRADIVVESDWGIGTLALLGSSLVSIGHRPNGNRFGGWLLDTVTNQVQDLIDFDGDGADDIVIRSPWGLGVLKRDGASYDSIALGPNGSVFGSWLLQNTDVIVAYGNFDGTGGTDILIEAFND